jgi:hypothetical protein
MSINLISSNAYNTGNLSNSVHKLQQSSKRQYALNPNLLYKFREIMGSVC